MRADREERIDHANACRLKMAEAMAIAWQNGERARVKITIDCALDATNRRQWKDDTALALPPEHREKFLEFMRS